MTSYFEKKTHAFVACPDINDCTAHWRVNQPLSEMELDDPNFSSYRMNYMETNGVQMWEMDRAHFVFQQRPFSAPHATMMHLAKMALKPTWIDYDDNLWDVPRVNPAFAFYNQHAKDIARIACQEAHAVTISTEFLANYIHDKVAPDANITVVNNALPDFYMWNDLPREKIVIYRGGKTHVVDLMSVADELSEVMEEFPDWTFALCGEEPWMVYPSKNMRVYPTRNIHEFHRWLYASKASVMIVPLIDCDFNRSKSNISWQEGSYAGAAVLAPDFPEFNVDGCTNYQQGKFGEALRSLLSATNEDRAELVSKSRSVIDDRYRLSVVNPLRAQVMWELRG